MPAYAVAEILSPNLQQLPELGSKFLVGCPPFPHMPSVILANRRLRRALRRVFIARMTRDYRWWGEIGPNGVGYLCGRMCQSTYGRQIIAYSRAVIRMFEEWKAARN